MHSETNGGRLGGGLVKQSRRQEHKTNYYSLKKVQLQVLSFHSRKKGGNNESVIKDDNHQILMHLIFFYVALLGFMHIESVV